MYIYMPACIITLASQISVLAILLTEEVSAVVLANHTVTEMTLVLMLSQCVVYSLLNKDNIPLGQLYAEYTEVSILR